MTRFLGTLVVAGVLACTAPSHAAPSVGDVTYTAVARPPRPTPDRNRTGPGYLGGCGFQTFYFPPVTGQSWIGTAGVDIQATTSGDEPAPTAPITNVRCEYLINGFSQGDALTAPNGTGHTANESRFEYGASTTDVVTMCTIVTVSGKAFRDCVDAEITQQPPQAAIDLATMLGGLLDPALCPLLWNLAPVVNALAQPGIVRIDDASGDLYLLGGKVWDCPPYGT